MDAVERARDAMRAFRGATIFTASEQFEKAFALVEEAFAVLEAKAAERTHPLPIPLQPTIRTIVGECKCDYKPELLGNWLSTVGSWACKNCGRLIPKSRVTPRILEAEPDGQEANSEARNGS